MTDPSWRKLPRDTLTDQVIGEIRRMVLNGTFKAGDMLPTQPELAHQLGVGVATVRRAIAALSAVGVVDSQPGRGTTVNSDALALLQAASLLAGRLDSAQVGMIYEARETIETRLAELAASRSTTEDHAAIRHALEEMEDSIADDVAFTAADLRFHQAVARAGRNELLAQFYNVSQRLLSETIEQVVSVKGVKEESLRLQWEVYYAIIAGKSEAARHATLAQLRYVEQLLHRAGLIQ